MLVVMGPSCPTDATAPVSHAPALAIVRRTRVVTGRVLLAMVVAIGLAACAYGDRQGFMEVPKGWEVHASGELGYQMAHPAGWEVRFDPDHGEDVYTGTEAEEVRVARYLEPDGWPADRIFLGALWEFEDRYGAIPALVEQLELDDGTRIPSCSMGPTSGSSTGCRRPMSPARLASGSSSSSDPSFPARSCRPGSRPEP